jgi:UDP-N-acetyl-D-mannosaminuronate dehydrogenase
MDANQILILRSTVAPGTTRKILDKLITEGVIEESKYSKDYYVIKNVLK